MFNSGITAADLIEQVKDEADIAIPIPDKNYIMWLNTVEQLIYTEIIQEQGETEVTDFSGVVIDISQFPTPADEDTVRFEDIHAVYADKTQLIKSTLASGVIFPNTYYKIQNNIGLNLKRQPQTVKIIYFVRPALKAETNIDTEYVRVPPEFTDLVKAKLRGEAYKLVNEDSIAAKWLNDYNVILENFKVWVQNKQSGFGL